MTFGEGMIEFSKSLDHLNISYIPKDHIQRNYQEISSALFVGPYTIGHGNYQQINST
jgi:hypothetical protein